MVSGYLIVEILDFYWHPIEASEWFILPLLNVDERRWGQDNRSEGGELSVETCFQHCKAIGVILWNSENHSKASPVREDENTLHQIGSLTTWNIIWFKRVRKWLSGLVVPSYFSKLDIFHNSCNEVSRIARTKRNFPSMWNVILDGLSPLLTSELSSIVCVISRFVLLTLPIREGHANSSPLISSTRVCHGGLGMVGVDGTGSPLSLFYCLMVAFSSFNIQIWAS